MKEHKEYSLAPEEYILRTPQEYTLPGVRPPPEEYILP